MKEKPSSSQGEEELPTNTEELPLEFKQFLEEEKLKNRALIMVDAMLEENPNLNTQEAFEKAIKLLITSSTITPSEICHNKDDEY